MSSDPIERARRTAKTGRQLGAADIGGALAVTALAVPVSAFALSLTAAIQGTDPASLIATPTAWALLVLSLAAIISVNGLCVSAGTAAELLRSSHLKSLEENSPSHLRLNSILNRRDTLVAACFMGSQTMRAWLVLVCFLPAPSLAAAFGFEGWTAALLAAVALSIPIAGLNVVFGELIPKSYATAYPIRTCLRLNGLMGAFAILFWLPTQLATFSAGLVTRRFGADASFSSANQAEEELKSLIETYSEAGQIEEEEVEMLDSVFEFGDTVAREIMTPRVDLDSISVTASLVDASRMITATGHSRIPVYEGSDDQILGIVHAKDILSALAEGNGKASLRSLMRPAIFVPENKGLHDLLQEMRLNRTQLVVVQDEFGGTSGIVTIEDMVEEVMGEIVDEYDVEEAPIVSAGHGWVVEGRLHLDDVNDEIGTGLASEEFDTLGGYVFGLFGRQPASGESVDAAGCRFTVQETDGRRILKVLVQALPDDLLNAEAV